MCCQVEVSATSCSLIQRSPTDWGASLCVLTIPRGRGGHSPRWAAEPEKIMNKMNTLCRLTCLEAFATTRFNKIFSGRQPCQRVKIVQHFGAWICSHLQDATDDFMSCCLVLLLYPTGAWDLARTPSPSPGRIKAHIPDSMASSYQQRPEDVDRVSPTDFGLFLFLYPAVCPKRFYCIWKYIMGHAMAQWLRHWATNRKVARSIPVSVTGIFRWHNPSGRAVADSASNRNE
jgi:hypothetical protein